MRITGVWRAAFASRAARRRRPARCRGSNLPCPGLHRLRRAAGSGPRSGRGGTPLSNTSRKGAADRVYPGTGQLAGTAEPRPLRRGQRQGRRDPQPVEASIAEAAKPVLGDTLGVNYVVSDKVKGSITIQTTKAIPREALLEMFEMMLAGEGAAIVVEQGIYRIVPPSEAVAAAPLRGKGRSYAALPGVSTQIIPLQYVAAAEMERIVKSIAPQCQPPEDRRGPQSAGGLGHARRPRRHHGRRQRVRRRLDEGHVVRPVSRRIRRPRGDRPGTRHRVRQRPGRPEQGHRAVRPQPAPEVGPGHHLSPRIPEERPRPGCAASTWPRRRRSRCSSIPSAPPCSRARPAAAEGLRPAGPGRRKRAAPRLPTLINRPSRAAPAD